MEGGKAGEGCGPILRVASMGLGEEAALGFGVDWITTVLFMATKSSHWLIMRKMVSQSFFIGSSPNLQAYNLR